MPSYMRHLEKDQNRVDPTATLGKDGTLFVVSRNQGWITVQKDKNRKRPVEKYGVSGDATKTSFLTPSWMQIGFPKNSSDPMQRVQPSGMNLRGETNRTFLIDRKQPDKSIWAFGDFRHNVHSKELAEKYNHQANSIGVVRMMEWKEQPTMQRFDKPVAGKIGSYHHQN